MATFIALLRGINVGGKNTIKMAKLKQVFEAIGLYEVQTYIQSGNVLFKSNEDEESLRNKIEQEIKTVFGFTVIVVLRTLAEIEWILEHCPFSEEEVKQAELSSDAESLYVALLAQDPTQDKIENLYLLRNESEDCIIVGREGFLLFRQSIRNSKLANNLQKLDVLLTVRNWKTINKLAGLAKAMNA